MSRKFFPNKITPKKVPVTARQVTLSAFTPERGDDSGEFLCTAVYPYYEYDANGQKAQTQTGWTYQCKVPARNNAVVLVKVNDMNCVVTEAELKLGPVPLYFADFKGTWWVNSNNFQELSCKAELAERVNPPTPVGGTP